MKESYPEVIEEPTYAEAMLLSDKLLTSFAAGEIGEIYLAYTHFKKHGEPRAEAVGSFCPWNMMQRRVHPQRVPMR